MFLHTDLEEIQNFSREMNADDLTCSLCLGNVLTVLTECISRSLTWWVGFDWNLLPSYSKHLKDIFTPPIRMTEDCGHNFCHGCLSNFIATKDNWICPECRSEQVKSADDLLRNRLVEKVVEQFNALQSQNESKPRCRRHGLELSICK